MGEWQTIPQSILKYIPLFFNELPNSLTPCHPTRQIFLTLRVRDLGAENNKNMKTDVKKEADLGPVRDLHGDLVRDLGKLRPCVIIDNREQTPLVFKKLPSERGNLYSSDYSFHGAESLFGVERKSIADLTSSVGSGRERLEHELHRLRGHRFKRFLIIGTKEEVEAHSYRSQIKPRAVLSTLSAFEARYDIPIVWAESPEKGAELVESWVFWFARELILRSSDILKMQGFSDLHKTSENSFLQDSVKAPLQETTDL